MPQLGEIEQVVDEIGEPAAARHDHFEIPALLVAKRSGRSVEHRLADADDAAERRAQLVRRVCQELVLEGVRPEQCRLGLLAGSDVANDAGKTWAIAAAHFADRQLHRERRAVPPQAFEFAADADDPRLAGPQVASDVLVVMLAVRRRREQGDVAADQFGGGIAEQTLDGRIGAFDDAMVIDGDDAVDGGVQNGLDARLALAQCRLCLLAGSDVANDAGKAWAVAAAHFADCQLHRERRAVPPQAFEFAADADDPRLAGPQVASDVLVVMLAVRRRREQGDVAADQFGGGIAEQTLDSRIGTFDDAMVIDGDDAVDGGVQNGLDASVVIGRDMRSI